jgi:hypothetical protein
MIAWIALLAEGHVSHLFPRLGAARRRLRAQAVRGLLASPSRWEVRSAGKRSKSKGRDGWVWLGTASPRHYLLIPRHYMTGELAPLLRLIRAAGFRWPVRKTSTSARTASAWITPRPASAPRSPGSPSWRWPPPAICGVTAPCTTAPTPGRRRQSGRANQPADSQ